MKGIVYWVLLVLCFPTMLFAQEKVDAPVWNVGDKWIFSNKGTIEVVSAGQNSYVLRFSDDICIGESWGCNTIIFEKNTLYRIYTLNGDKRKKYTKAKRRIFNFPLSPGKQWRDLFSTTSVVAPGYGVINYYESFKVLGWEDIEVQAGKFKAIKLEVKTGHTPQKGASAWESQILYWYSPEAKYFVKCQYDFQTQFVFSELVSWELTAFILKK